MSPEVLPCWTAVTFCDAVSLQAWTWIWAGAKRRTGSSTGLLGLSGAKRYARSIRRARHWQCSGICDGIIITIANIPPATTLWIISVHLTTDLSDVTIIRPMSLRRRLRNGEVGLSIITKLVIDPRLKPRLSVYITLPPKRVVMTLCNLSIFSILYAKKKNKTCFYPYRSLLRPGSYP